MPRLAGRQLHFDPVVAAPSGRRERDGLTGALRQHPLILADPQHGLHTLWSTDARQPAWQRAEQRQDACLAERDLDRETPTRASPSEMLDITTLAAHRGWPDRRDDDGRRQPRALEAVRERPRRPDRRRRVGDDRRLADERGKHI